MQHGEVRHDAEGPGAARLSFVVCRPGRCAVRRYGKSRGERANGRNGILGVGHSELKLN
jgi:hypothetical protein